MQKSRKCMHCFLDFKTTTSLLNHIANDHHPTVSHSTTSADSCVPLCTGCRGMFPTVKALQQHSETCDVDFWVGSVFITTLDIDIKFDMVTKIKWQCDMCHCVTVIVAKTNAKSIKRFHFFLFSSLFFRAEKRKVKNDRS